MDHYHLATRGDNDGLWDWNLAAGRVHFAPRWVAMVGHADHEVGHSPDEWLNRVHPEDRPEVRREIDAQLAEGTGEFSIRHRMLHKDGTYRWMTCRAVVERDESGRPVRMMGCHSDVTADTVADGLTGLPNRLLFLDRLERAIEQARRSPDWFFAALVLDLDRAAAGDPSAPGAGDALVSAAARRLETCLRAAEAPASLGHEYVVSRLGGGQFGVLLEGLAQVGEASVSAQRILAGMLAPFSIGGHDVFVQASVGIAVSVTGYRRAEEVLRDADTAVHRARALGKGRCEMFDTAALDSARSQLEMEAELEKAIERREFVLFYQPIVSVATNRIAGLEALVRWRHPRRGLVAPMEFIPLAEKTGAIVRIGAWVVREACRQLAAWRASLPIPRDTWVSVNLSSVQFRDPSLFEQIGSAVRDAGLDPRCLMVELTESTVMDNPAAAKGVIMQLRVLGVRVGIDDFGTGHSTLASLHQFPADFLKVDRSFVRGLDARQDMAEIVRTVNELADQLGLEVIVEGIERDEQMAVVRSLRCAYVQGFLLARPVDHEQTAALLRSGLAPAPGRPKGREQVAEGASATAAPEPVRRWTEFPWGWRSLGAAAAAVVFLVSVGLVVRGASGTRSPAATPPAVAVGETARGRRSLLGSPGSLAGAASEARSGAPATQPGASPAEPGRPVPQMPEASAAERMKSSTASPPTAVRGAPAARRAASPYAPAGPAVEFFQVVHLHALGTCTGQLIVTPTGLTFAPQSSKDGFTLPYQSFLVALADGALVIKSDKRTYRFKAPGEAGGSGVARVQAAYDAIRKQSRRSSN